MYISVFFDYLTRIRIFFGCVPNLPSNIFQLMGAVIIQRGLKSNSYVNLYQSFVRAGVSSAKPPLGSLRA